MSRLIRGRLDEGDRRQLSDADRIRQIAESVLMLRLVRLTDARDGTRRKMMRVQSRSVILKRCVVRILLRNAGCYAVARALGSPVALEPAPGNALGVQEVANVLAAQRVNKRSSSIHRSSPDLHQEWVIPGNAIEARRGFFIPLAVEDREMDRHKHRPHRFRSACIRATTGSRARMFETGSRQHGCRA